MIVSQVSNLRYFLPNYITLFTEPSELQASMISGFHDYNRPHDQVLTHNQWRIFIYQLL